MTYLHEDMIPDARVPEFQAKLGIGGDGGAINVATFGLSPAASAAANLAAFKAAVAFAPAGSRLIVPAAEEDYIIDTSGGLSQAINLNKSLEILILGNLKASFGTEQVNPPFIFNVTGHRVRLHGNGTIKGDGTVNSDNSGDDDTFAGLIYVTGMDFSCENLNFNKSPRLSISLYNTVNALIRGCRFSGGVIVNPGDRTAYFGIRATGGGGHTITENWFGVDAEGGKISNCIFFGGNVGIVSRCIVSKNHLTDAWEKLVYGYMNYTEVVDNILLFPSGNYSDAIRVAEGFSNIIDRNHVTGANGGVSVYNSSGTKIRYNTFIGCKQVGVYIRKQGAYTGGFSDTEIIGNWMTRGDEMVGDGISLVSDGASSSRIIIKGNTVTGFGLAGVGEDANIRLEAPSPYTIEDSLIEDNIVDGTSIAVNGIWLGRGVNCIVSNNAITRTSNVGIVFDGCYRSYANDNALKSPGLWGISMNEAFASSACLAGGNKTRGATNVGIKNLGADNFGTGNNTYSDTSLVGLDTLAASVDTVFNHDGIAPNARVMYTPANGSGGLMASASGKGYPYTTVGVGLYTASVPNGTAAAGTEQFHRQIIQ